MEGGRRTKIIYKNDKRRADVPKNDATLNEDSLINREEDVKVANEPSRSLSFCERMKELSPRHHPLNDQ